MEARKIDFSASNGKQENVKPFGNGDRFGYMFGDLGNSLLFNLVSSYLLVFYTDVLGISAAAVGTLMIVSRIWDAINDPMMGVFVDKAKPSKHGKFRPYFIYAGIPLGIFGLLTFTAIPGIPEGMKLPYAYITYIGFGMAYTAINIPYGSLASVMTSDPVERTSLSTFRSLGNLLANLILMTVTPMLIFNAEGAVTASGFVKAAAIYAVLANICYVLTFKMTTERIQPTAKESNGQKTSLLETIKMIFKNRALLGIMLATFGVMTGVFLTSALQTYMFKDYFQAPPALITLGGLSGILSSFLVMPFGGKLVAKFGKKEVASSALITSIALYAVLFFMPIKNAYLYIGLTFLANIGVGFFNLLVWALVGDAIDYHEYIAGTRDEGVLYASYSLVRKLVQAIVGGISGFALAFIGYQSGVATQAPEVLSGIKAIATGVPFVSMIVGFVGMAFVFNLSKSKLAEMTNELNRRRAN